MARPFLQFIPGRHRKLGQILIETGLLNQEQLERALAVQRETRQRLGHVLASLGFVSDQQIAAVLADQLNLPLVDLRQHEPDNDALGKVSKELATRHSVFPLKLHDNHLTLVMADPLNIHAEDAIRAATGLTIRPAVASESQVVEQLMKYYPEEEAFELLGMVAPEPGETVINVDETPSNPRELLEASGFDSVIKAVNSILADAVKRAASDIHIEPYEQSVRLRYRMDGQLKQIAMLPVQAYPAVVSRLKVLANLDIAENRRPQDGSFKLFIGSQSVSFRLSTLRTGYGEKVVIRILDNSMKKAGLSGLGLDPVLRERLESLLNQPQGLLLVTGPTGSGKTTTLYAALNGLRSDEMNIVTVEDPIEYQLPGINQVQVDERAGITFASALRSILRQDPNVIMVGEIRDMETAQIAVRASLTGHLVLATLHTNDAPSSPSRLLDMGVEPFLLGVSLIGVIAQRLVRRLCPECSQGQGKPMGCRACGLTGYSGRLGVYELLSVDTEVRAAISRGANAADIEEAARRNGFRTMMEDAQEKVTSGLTTAEQVVAVVGSHGGGHGAAAHPTVSDETTEALLASIQTNAPPVAAPSSNGASGKAPHALPDARPIIRLQVETNRIRMAAVQDSNLLAAQTYNQGIEDWQASLAKGIGIPKDKLLPLLRTFSANGGSPFSDIIQRTLSPLIQVLHSTMALYPETGREKVVVQVKWDAREFPGLLEALHTLEPSFNFEAFTSDTPLLTAVGSPR